MALAELATGLRDRHGDEAGAAAESAGRLIATIERGYLAVSEELDAMLAGAPPEEWLWAVLDRAADLVDLSLGEIDRRAAATPMIDGSVFALPDGDGGAYRADELIAMVDATTSMCVRMLAARHNWHDRDGAIILPRRPNPLSPKVNAAKLMRLSEIWEMWRRMETGARFLGCVLNETEDSGQTVRSMKSTREAMSWRLLAHIAHEQLSVEITSVFNQMIHRENAHLADGMRQRPGALADMLGENCEGLEVIPCVVGAMPESRPSASGHHVFYDAPAAWAKGLRYREALPSSAFVTKGSPIDFPGRVESRYGSDARRIPKEVETYDSAFIGHLQL